MCAKKSMPLAQFAAESLNDFSCSVYSIASQSAIWKNERLRKFHCEMIFLYSCKLLLRFGFDLIDGMTLRKSNMDTSNSCSSVQLSWWAIYFCDSIDAAVYLESSGHWIVEKTILSTAKMKRNHFHMNRFMIEMTSSSSSLLDKCRKCKWKLCNAISISIMYIKIMVSMSRMPAIIGKYFLVGWCDVPNLQVTDIAWNVNIQFGTKFTCLRCSFIAYFGSLAIWLVCSCWRVCASEDIWLSLIRYTSFPWQCRQSYDLSLSFRFLHWRSNRSNGWCLPNKSNIIKCRGNCSQSPKKFRVEQVMKRKRGHSDKRCVHFYSFRNVSFVDFATCDINLRCLPLKTIFNFYGRVHKAQLAALGDGKNNKIWLEKWFPDAHIFHEMGQKDDGEQVFGVISSLLRNMRKLNHGINGSATMFQLAFIHCCKFILLLVRLHRANNVPISDEWFFSPLIDLCKFSTSTRNSQSNWRPKIKSYNEQMVVTGIWLKMGRLTRYTNTQFSLHFSCNFSVSRFFWWNTLY